MALLEEKKQAGALNAIGGMSSWNLGGEFIFFPWLRMAGRGPVDIRDLCLLACSSLVPSRPWKGDDCPEVSRD